MTTVHDRIRMRIAALRTSLRGASLASGMSPEAISTILRNTSMSPTLATIEKLAKGLQTSPEWLAFGVEVSARRDAPQPAAIADTSLPNPALTATRGGQNSDISPRHDMRSIQVSVGELHRLVSGALQNENIAEAEADIYADVVLELLKEQTIESVVLRLKESGRNALGSQEPTSADLL